MATTYFKIRHFQTGANKNMIDYDKLYNELPNAIPHICIFSEEQDNFILRAWEKKQKYAIAKILGMDYKTVKRRYEYLTGEK